MATKEVFFCEMLSVWIFEKLGISHNPKTPVENPTTRRLEAAWKVEQTTLVPAGLK